MEYIAVKLILPDRNLAICNLYSPPIKAINLHILQPNSEDWMIVWDFNSHSPSWGYPSLDAKGKVEHWIVTNRLVLTKIPLTDPPAFYSRVWKMTSTSDIAIATDNIQTIVKREISEQLGGSDHKPVILTLAKQINTSAGKCLPVGTKKTKQNKTKQNKTKQTKKKQTNKKTNKQQQQQKTTNRTGALWGSD